MSGPDPAVADVRRAVRALLRRADPGRVVVAVSGGADSLALAAAAAHLRPVEAVVVDHGLQPGSAEVAARVVDQLAGIDVPARVVQVTVSGPGGIEAAARRARYAALRAAAGDGLVLLGHTRDDQAETVLLGLGRGSGPRSIAGMRPLDPPWGRPLLDLPRATTAAACAALGLTPWQDPHNADPRFTRVRLRTEVLPLMEEVLQGGVAAALARTAAQLREDLAALDDLAATLLTRAGDPDGLIVAELTGAPPALRRRVLRTWLLGRGVPELTDAHLRACDDLVGDWRGQRGVALPGGFVARRAHGRLSCERPS
ncbi:tRNA lysidine(34) synthetase TilS [Actinokineospora sp. NPDC004072]